MWILYYIYTKKESMQSDGGGGGCPHSSHQHEGGENIWTNVDDRSNHSDEWNWTILNKRLATSPSLRCAMLFTRTMSEKPPPLQPPPPKPQQPPHQARSWKRHHFHSWGHYCVTDAVLMVIFRSERSAAMETTVTPLTLTTLHVGTLYKFITPCLYPQHLQISANYMEINLTFEL
jgi:hypothetical protein